MGQAIARQQPAVILRSQFNHLRALLAVALVAIAGLTAAVVMLANDGNELASTSAAKPSESINSGDRFGYGSWTGRPESPSAPYGSWTGRPESPSAPYGSWTGRPESPSTAYGGGIVSAPQASASSAVEAKDEAASAAAIGQSSDGTVTRGSKASQFGTSQYRFAQPQTGAPVQPQTGTTAQP